MQISKELQQLKDRLEGKTITSVEPPERGEAICKFVLSDGTAFILFATELGFWMEDTIAKQGDKYSNFNALFPDCGHYAYKCSFGGDYTEPKIKATIDSKKNILKILVSKKGKSKEFVADISKFSDWEKKICNDDRGKKLIECAAGAGIYWKMAFDKDRDCPEDIALEQEDDE